MPKRLQNRDLARDIGQLLIIGFEGTAVSPGHQALLHTIQPAGVILFARNITGAEQTYRLLADCKACVETPMFLCVDMEGGRVDRLKNVFSPAPAPAQVFTSRDRRLFRKHGKVIGDSCRLVGFNTDFAPTLDLAFQVSSSVMGSRAVSDDPAHVVIYAREFLAGLRAAGVLGAGKHFPGLGEANLDTHHELPSVAKSWKKLWQQDIQPYRSLRRELSFVMVGHAAYPSVTKEPTPASLSKKWITGVLKQKVGYRGLIVSDDLEMGGVLAAGPIEQAAIGHIRAGGDLCLICHQEEFVTRAYQALIRQAERDRRFAGRVRESAARVLAFKKRAKELRRRTSAPTAARLDKMARQLWEFSEQVRLESLP